MKHLGDITKIHGSETEPVNVIIGGSPCQDSSVAGKRAGLEGERSGLFMDQIRIIKESRFVDEVFRGRKGQDIRPRYMVWENVPGALSSPAKNKGADFGAVLQETVRVVFKEAPTIPMPEKGWPTAGCLTGVGEGGAEFSIAWRIYDAQFWGVPQRRRRIALVADFGGLTGPEILFERKSVSGDYPEGRTARETVAADAENSIIGDDSILGAAGFCTEHSAKARSIGYEVEKSPTLRAGTVPATTYCIQGNCIDRADTAGCNGKGWTEDVSYTLNTIDRPAVMQPIPLLNDQGGSSIFGEDDANVSPTLRAEMHGNIPAVAQTVMIDKQLCIAEDVAPALTASGYKEPIAVAIENHPNDSRVKLSEDNVIQTLSGRMGTGGGNTPMILECYEIGNGQVDQSRLSEVCGTLNCMHDQRAVMVQNIFAVKNDATPKVDSEGKAFTLGARDYKDPQSVAVPQQGYIVRRLTPLECERSQGFPDHWTDIGDWVDSNNKKHKGDADSSRYKALGNSIALPSWMYVLQKLSLMCGPDKTMASLFDGIGGFPLIWETLHGKGSCVWASEIEEFPIAVTKKRFNAEKTA